MKTLITAYENPDLDGTACAYAYAEFLNKNGRNVVAGVFGKPHREAQYVFDKFSIEPINDANKLNQEIDSIIIVDASDIRGLSDKINPEKVIEIIDHRKVNEADNFSNAKVQIELVGSAATLIAEKFYESRTSISKESAVLLYSAIVSNTINFKANVTTERDHKMAEWLLSQFEQPDNYIHEMFKFKSKFTQPLSEIIEGDFSTPEFEGIKVGIAQLEIINAKQFVEENLVEITNILNNLKIARDLDYVFLTCIDIEIGRNYFLAIDELTGNVLEKILNIKFETEIAERDGIIMRKEITPLLKAYFDEEVSVT
ncbi:MAG TPA: DHH family phosphoesterase [Candidatus Dojkabacteria bacterium]|nr:DHH family phosphoesterase [Candidatus Dojkabacteria bacterium]HRP51390.1 DHH family phosphoesterase [Candidatus Dojkabacteria bacterium]